MAGLFQRLDTHMVDSHLMLSAMKLTSKIRRNYPAKWARDAANDLEYLGTLWRFRKKAGLGQGGGAKKKRHEQPKNPGLYYLPRKTILSRGAPSRQSRCSAH